MTATFENGPDTPPRVRIYNILSMGEGETWRLPPGETPTDPWSTKGFVRLRRFPGSQVDYDTFDYEMPQGQGATYVFDSGSVFTVDVPSFGPWLIAPGRPELSVPLTFERGAFSGWKRSADRTVTQVPGRDNAVTVEFRRKAATGTVRVVTQTPDETDALQACLNAGGPMLLSLPPEVWPAFGHASAWVSIGDVEDEPQFDLSGRQVWVTSFDITPVDRPVAGLDLNVRIADLEGLIGTQVGTLGNLGST